MTVWEVAGVVASLITALVACILAVTSYSSAVRARTLLEDRHLEKIIHELDVRTAKLEERCRQKGHDS
jgi:hypothetical protein